VRRLTGQFEKTPYLEEIDGWLRAICEISSEEWRDGDVAIARQNLSADMMCGRIERIASAGTFGFILGDDGEEHFFHNRNLAGRIHFSMLRKGDRVSFRRGTNEKGTIADEVTLVGEI
jgi:cold shock CspA family protein